MIRLIFSFLLIFISLSLQPGSCCFAAQAQKKGTWKAGTARVIITPQQPMWLAGFGSRNQQSEGKIHDLWAKALVLEDTAGNQVLLITLDLNGIPRDISNRIRRRIQEKFGFTKAQIILNTSHTHSGPVIHNYLYDVYPISDELKERSRIYTENLEDKVVTLAGTALATIEPVKIFSGNGVARFQVNRRNNTESALYQQTELNGPNDFSVPVIKVTDKKGSVKAVVFGYSCHPSVLSLNKFSGDYPGFAQLELEKFYPGATAMFFQGAGADQNALPRNTIPLARQYGRELAAAVKRMLEEGMKELSPLLTTVYKEIDLPFAPQYTVEELEKIKKDPSKYQQRWATRMLEKTRRGDSIPSSYPYPMQVWRLGEQPVMALGGELVVQYAIDLKRIYGPELFIMGYSNDIMTYIPSERILKEGQYEGFLANMIFGLPGTMGCGHSKYNT